MKVLWFLIWVLIPSLSLQADVKTHVIGKGDTLYSISKHYGVDIPMNLAFPCFLIFSMAFR